MDKGRVEAFSDGMFAIFITIMVLTMKPPSSADLAELLPLWPVFLSYVLSFVFIGIYWNNHHHVFQAVERVDGAVLWANLHLLFWISLVSFITNWMGESHFSTWPVVAYGAVMLMCAFAWDIERRTLIRLHAPDSALVKAMSRNIKEWLSLVLYAVAIGMAFVHTWMACTLYGAVAAMWLIPDRRIAREMGNEKE
jgi:uncharacterized membrane protein